MRQHQQHPQLNMRKGGWGQTGSLSELEESLTAAALPEGVVRAIQSQAAAWPSLSKVRLGSNASNRMVVLGLCLFMTLQQPTLCLTPATHLLPRV